MTPDNRGVIAIRGARQHNLRNLDLDIPLGELIVVTGVSGSGKSSLVFDTLYAEGQRRYVETFSPYARQFLDRMDKPQVDRIDGVPPAIAIDQTNPVRTSRSTVGTMTELNDHLKLLYARAGHLHCRRCGAPVRRESAESIATAIIEAAAAAGDPRLTMCFPVAVPKGFDADEIRALLARQGYTRILESGKKARGKPAAFEVVQDRLQVGTTDRARLLDSLESALQVGQGRVNMHVGDDGGTWRYSTDLHCATCDLSYREPSPSAFSFNSPVGACETCRGFGRVIGVDYGLVVPDGSKTLREGAIRPFQSKSYRECQDDLEKYAKRRGVPLDVPWRDLEAAHREWVITGEGGWNQKVWYGTRRFFAWLESRAYKMHVRVLLSRYRSYTPCESCGGARLKAESLLWRVGDAVTTSNALPGLNIHELMLLPIAVVRRFVMSLELPAPLDAASELLLGEIRNRLRFLDEVGLGYLTLDRQSRTLSGGEVQRINLTTALGTSLVNTLFVLDEPSIGLHPRDMGRVIEVMHRLRDAGNSLLVVEHDPQIMVEADRILDLGPGAGERGGAIVCFDTPAAVCAHAQSSTGAYLAGRRHVDESATGSRKDWAADTWLGLLGATANNLKTIDVRFPLGGLTCVTGVSGSGKSTLIEDVLYPALRKALGQAGDTAGAHRELVGFESITDVVLIDQKPIGRTTRSTPGSYVGALDAIRTRFAAAPAAIAQGYTRGTFSFNSGTGRCPTCGGNGFEHIEMQFLSDVYLRCETCDGRRFRDEVLEVRIHGATGQGASIADLLQMTATEAHAFFADAPDVQARLAPLLDVGLDYLRLGQPVPTLSGGEAQRLKLAGHLADAAAKGAARGKLFLFDEPTTGLHFEDVARLLRALRALVAAGHSLIVIEHNLDLILASDWLIDLGPEGGDAGGEIVAEGTPGEVMRFKESATGRAMRDYAAARSRPTLRVADASKPATHRPALANEIVIHNAREHNLRGIDVRIPRERFTVITGVSGSGKSTLAFDILFAEGQRRYLESLNAYARQFVQPASRPDVDAIHGIPPTVAIEQRTSRGGRKSTVATLTEIYHFLRLAWIKLGTQYCPTCDVAIEPQSPEALAATLARAWRGQPLVGRYSPSTRRWETALASAHLARSV